MEHIVNTQTSLRTSISGFQVWCNSASVREILHDHMNPPPPPVLHTKEAEVDLPTGYDRPLKRLGCGRRFSSSRRTLAGTLNIVRSRDNARKQTKDATRHRLSMAAHATGSGTVISDRYLDIPTQVCAFLWDQGQPSQNSANFFAATPGGGRTGCFAG